jgi:hypothetical protein
MAFMQRKLQWYISVPLLAIVGFWSACTADRGPMIKNALNTCDTITNHTWNNGIGNIITSKCGTPSCHSPSGTGPGNFSDYNAVLLKVNDGSLRQRVVINRDMPPPASTEAAQVTECDRKKIERWIDAGGPQ